jgi:hypothetical protein
MNSRRALIVRGGWPGHQPAETTDLFVPFLEENGFDVRIEELSEIYADAAVMAETDLIVQCVSMSEISAPAIKGLREAVVAGTGFAGWHGGIVDSYRMNSDYLQLVGGQFVKHPSKVPEEIRGDGADSFLPHTIDITALGRDHEITRGIPDFELTTEQYWVLHDDLNDVLATTTHPARPDQPWHRRVISPAVWTRAWGAGRVFVATPGHDTEVLRDANVRTIVERGLLWAARGGST